MKSAKVFWKPVFAFALLAVSATAAPAGAPVFGSVVAIGGSASDIAIDESRHLLYIADLAGGVIRVMSTADNALRPSSLDGGPLPGAIALSLDSQYLLVANYCNFPAGADGISTALPCANTVTSIHLTDNSKATFRMTDPPLGVAFIKSGQAMVITTTAILFLD